MASVELRNVWKLYGEVVAVEDVSWRCGDGEFFSILGPSGCGKSSTLRMVAGLELISAGEIYFDDRRVNELPPNQRNVAMVFETWALYPNLSVYDNIAFPLWVRGESQRAIDRRVRWAAEFLGLEDSLTSGVRGLSGGQKQRVAIGRAIVRQPAVLIMDEPISHLDAGLRARMREELEDQVRRLGVTTLYITHDQVESMAMADRIAVMNLGRIQQIGPPEQIYNNPANAFVAGFVGEPPMNFADCTLISSEGKAHLRSPSIEVDLDGPPARPLLGLAGEIPVRLGVRPEDVRLGPPGAEGSVPAQVEFVEPQGDRTILTVRLRGREIFLIEADADVRPALGEAVGLAFVRERVQVFRAESGESLIYGWREAEAGSG